MLRDAVLSFQLTHWKASALSRRKPEGQNLEAENFPCFPECGPRPSAKARFAGDGWCLHPDPEQQSWLENWIGFQDYHLAIQEDFEKEIMDHGKNLDAARKKLEKGPPLLNVGKWNESLARF